MRIAALSDIRGNVPALQAVLDEVRTGATPGRVPGPHARRALLQRQADGQWRVEHRVTPYDWAAAAARADRNGRGDWADALPSGVVGRLEKEVIGA